MKGRACAVFMTGKKRTCVGKFEKDGRKGISRVVLAGEKEERKISILVGFGGGEGGGTFGGGGSPFPCTGKRRFLLPFCEEKRSATH